MKTLVISTFLQATKYCDCRDRLIVRQAQETTSGCRNDRERATALFEFVRDNVLFNFDYWNTKASSTLKKRHGMCTNKANLLVALLRACKIPAGYGLLRVTGDEYFGPIMLPKFKKYVSHYSVHTYCCAHLGGRWVKCDPSTDTQLSDRTSYFNYSTRLVQWNGVDDALDHIDPSHVITDTSPLANIDDRLERKPRTITRLMLKLGDRYLDFLRTRRHRFSSTEEMEQTFFDWLSDNHSVLNWCFQLVDRSVAESVWLRRLLCAK